MKPCAFLSAGVWIRSSVWIALSLTLVVAIAFTDPVPAGDELRVGLFSSQPPGDQLPENWQPLEFKKIPSHTRYRLVQDSGRTVIKADSNASSSGLVRRMTIDPQRYPLIQWQWKAMNTLAHGDVMSKKGDDYPARLYITFEYDPSSHSFLERAKYSAAKLLYGEYPPDSAITYLWASKAPVNTMVPNPYTASVMMIVLETGSKALGTWVSEERNIVSDFQAAFGRNPPAISGVAIMTDTDNTSESCVTYYGDIVFKSLD